MGRFPRPEGANAGGWSAGPGQAARVPIQNTMSASMRMILLHEDLVGAYNPPTIGCISSAIPTALNGPIWRGNLC